ncbi:MAG: Rrf2 family transcriptional regulator [Parvularculales bacterium]
MLQPSRKALLALEAIMDIAVHARPDPVQSRDITERQGIPKRYLEQAMQNLVRAGILKGVRGPRGGYRLARERRRISVGEIVRLVDGLDTQTPTATSPLNQKVLLPLWQEVQNDLIHRLDKVTLEDLYCRAQQEQIVVTTESTPQNDFTI